MKTWPEISAIMQQRRLFDTALKRQMIDVRDRVNGDVVIALPDVDGGPSVPISTPHLIADAIEQNAMRAASTTPIIHVPALDPTSLRSRDRANTRRRALYAAWDHSSLIETILPRSYRHLCGYGTNALVVVPDFERNRARIETRDPLTAYPEHRSPEDTSEPRDVGFVFGRSPQWLMAHYPECKDFFEKASSRSNHRTAQRLMETLWDVVEWIDEDQITMGILGPRDTFSDIQLADVFPGGAGLHLRTWDNRAGMVPVAAPRRVTLDRIDGQVSKLTGIVDMMGKLMALDVLAAEKAVFADMVVIDKNGTPQLLNASGKWNDGRTGEANLVKADRVDLLQSSPGPLTHPVIDRLERNFRVSGGMPGMLSGENSNALRTGNALDTMGSISVDPRIQELQRLMTRGLKVVNTATVEIELGYFPNRKQVFFSGWPGDFGHVEYTPSKDFDSNENAVAYAFPGTDINQLTVAIGQSVGTGLISKKTGRAKHPLINDPDAEERNIIAEQIEEAAMATFIQQAQAGALPLIDLVNIYEEYKRTGSWTAAIKKADDDARDRQAAEAPTPTEAAPGLSMPGMGASAGDLGTPQIPGAQPAELDFQQLMNALSTGGAR